MNAVCLLIHLNRFSLLAERIYQKNKAKKKRKKLNPEAVSLQTVKSYVTYNIIVSINSNDSFAMDFSRREENDRSEKSNQ